MAISLVSGFEMGSPSEAIGLSGSPSVQGTTVRSGSYALRVNPTATTSAVRWVSRAAGGSNRSSFLSCRFYLRVASLPTAITRINIVFGTVSLKAVLLGTDGKIHVATANNTTIGVSSTSALSADGMWHRIDVDRAYNAGAGVRVSVDGVVWVSDSATAQAADTTGGIGAWDSTTCDLYFDDVVWYDSALPATLGDYKLDMLLPTADSAIGNWRTDTGGAGGSTSLFDAVNNRPPVGDNTTNATATTQISNASNLGFATCDLTCATYDSVVSAGGSVLAVQSVVNDGQEVTTGSPKPGSVLILSNPSGQAEQSFDYGLPNGTAGSTSAAAVGVFPAGWGTHVGVVTENPTVTPTSGPVVRVFNRNTTTRVVDVDFLGVYVMWEAAAAAGKPIEYRQGRNMRQAVNRAAHY